MSVSNDLIVKLMEQTNDEAEHGQWCDSGLSTNERIRKISRGIRIALMELWFWQLRHVVDPPGEPDIWSTVMKVPSERDGRVICRRSRMCVDERRARSWNVYMVQVGDDSSIEPREARPL